MQRIWLTISLLVTFVLCIAVGNAQQTYPVKVNQQWGLIDSSGAIVIEPRFEAIGTFESGYAIVQANDRFGVIREDGQMIVPTEYTRIVRNQENHKILMLLTGGEVFNGMRRGGVWGFFNQENEKLLAPAYNSFSSFEEPLITVRKGKKEGLVNLEGEVVLPCEYDVVKVRKGGNALIGFQTEGGMGLADLAGNVVLEPAYTDIQPQDNGSFLLAFGANWGAANPDGRVWIEPKYATLKPASEGHFYFSNQDSIWGLVDSAGTEVIPARYRRLICTGSKWIQAGDSAGMGMLDKTGKLVLPLKFEQAFGLNDEYVTAQLDKLWGVYDKNGKEVLPHAYQNVSLSDESAFVCTVEEGKVLLDKKGTPLVKDTLDEIQPYLFSVAIFEKKGKFGLLHADGTVIAEPVYSRIERFETVCQLYNGYDKTPLYLTKEGKVTKRRQLMVVKTGGQKRASGGTATWGQNQTGFGQSERSLGWYWSTEKRGYGLRRFDTERNIDRRLIAPKYKSVNVVPTKDLTRVAIQMPGNQNKAKNLYGLVNHERGKEITPPAFIELRHFDFVDHNVARAINQGGRYVLIRKDGKILSNSEITYIGEFSHGMVRICKGGKKQWAMKKSPSTLERIPRTDRFNRVKGEYLEINHGKWGLVDKNGSWKLTAQYEHIGRFEGGLAPVKLDGKWGLIDTNLTVVIQPQYDGVEIMQLADNYFIRTDIKSPSYGYINSKGDMVLQARYQNAGKFSEGLAAAQKEDKWGYIDPQGNWVIEAQFRDAGPFSGGLARVRAGKRGWQYINTSGALAFEQKFYRLREFHEGRAAAQLGGAWGYIDESGAWIVEPQFRKALDFKEGVAIVTKKGRTGIIDLNGKWVVPAKYYKIEPFQDGLAKVRLKSGFGFVDREGNKVVKAKYRRLGDFHEGLAYFKDGYQYGFLDRTGKVVIKDQFAQAKDFNEGIAAVRLAGKWGFIDSTGTMILQPQHPHVRSFSEGYAAVRSRGNWAFIGTDGSQKTDFVYREVQNFSEGRAAVLTSKGWGFLNDNCAMAIAPEYDQVMPFENGIAKVKKGTEWGYINTLGSPATLTKFRELRAFSEGLAAVRIELQAGLFDRRGKTILEANFDSIQLYEDLLQVETAGKIGYLGPEGEWVWELMD